MSVPPPPAPEAPPPSAAPAARIAVSAPLSDEDVDLFGPYTALVPITVLGQLEHVPENNSVLRALQYLELKTGRLRLDWGRYCWNDTKGCCVVSVRDAGGAPVTLRACRLAATDGLELLSLPPGGRRC